DLSVATGQVICRPNRHYATEVVRINYGESSSARLRLAARSFFRAACGGHASRTPDRLPWKASPRRRFDRTLGAPDGAPGPGVASPRARLFARLLGGLAPACGAATAPRAGLGVPGGGGGRRGRGACGARCLRRRRTILGGRNCLGCRSCRGGLEG